jgi:hypothetical protein
VLARPRWFPAAGGVCSNTLRGAAHLWGVAPTAAIVRVVVVGTSVQWGIVGGTGNFRNARGEVTAVVVAPGLFDLTYDLD